MPTRALYPWETILNTKKRILLKRGEDFREDLFTHSFVAQIYQNHKRLKKLGKVKQDITVRVIDDRTVSVERRKVKKD